MGTGVVPSAAPAPGERAWRARIYTADGRDVLGAGIALGTRHILTCAHVVGQAAGPGTEVFVELVGWSPPVKTTARVIPGCWFPERDDKTADVALLELASATPRDSQARLSRRLLPVGLAVQIFGFPGELDFARYLPATVAGPTGPGDEWVQLDTPVHQPVRRGYSGGAVVDLGNGQIVGMLVMRHTDESEGVAWMMRVETILRYLPPWVEQWTDGPPGVSPRLRQPSPERPRDDQPARQITSLFTHSGPGRVEVITTGDRDSPTSVAVRWVVTLADRQQRVAAPDQVRNLVKDGTVPPTGSIDLALDVAGRTVEEVIAVILGRLGHPTDEPMRAWDQLLADPPRMNLVVIGIDDAADPDRLIAQVLSPLVGVARERGLRMLLGFARRSVSSEGLARLPHRFRLDQLSTRLDKLEREVGRTQQLRDKVAARIAAAPEVPDGTAPLRRNIAVIQSALPGRDIGRLSAMIDECEAAVDAESRAVKAIRDQLKRLYERHQELNGRLAAFHVEAGDREDAKYRQAQALLARRPCDLTAAAAAVDRYAWAVSGEPGPAQEEPS